MKYLITLLSCISISLATDGKIGGVTYFDFISANDSTAFNFQRQYFMYGIDVSDNISFKVVFDVGRTNIGTVLDKEDAEKKGETFATKEELIDFTNDGIEIIDFFIRHRQEHFQKQMDLQL